MEHHADYVGPTPGNMSYIQSRNLSALKDLAHQVGIDDLSDACHVRLNFRTENNKTYYTAVQRMSYLVLGLPYVRY